MFCSFPQTERHNVVISGKQNEGNYLTTPETVSDT